VLEIDRLILVSDMTMHTKRPFEGLSNAEIEFIVRRAHVRWRWKWLNIIVARWRWRLTLSLLRRLDDHQLADIGVRRDQLRAVRFRWNA
jgi:uncharacterized protein YjiS (DUF1127 family)